MHSYLCDSILFQLWSLSDEALTNGQVFVLVASEFLHSSWPVRILLFFLHVEVSDFFSGRGWWGGWDLNVFFAHFTCLTFSFSSSLVESRGIVKLKAASSLGGPSW